MCDFKVGDKIQVVRSAGSVLEQGEIYTAHEIYLKDGSTYVTLYTDGRKNRDGWDIDRFVKYEEKENTLKIDMQKKYRMVGTHESVRVICVDRKVEDYSIYCVGLCLTEPNVESMVYFDHYGNNISGEQLIEEVPEVDWSKVKADTLIWVDGIPRYFASSSKYYVYFFQDGCTSKTNTQPTAWAHKSNCSLEEPK